MMNEEMDDIIPRTEVFLFAEAMERRLRKNDYKGGWKDSTDEYLSVHLLEEVAELLKTLNLTKKELELAPIAFKKMMEDKGVVGHDRMTEAMDVANYAMMLWDNTKKGVDEKWYLSRS